MAHRAARPPDIDARTADRLLAGRMQPDDAPPGLAALAHALHDAASAAPSVRPDAELLGSMAETIRDGSATGAPTSARRRSFLAKLLTAKIAAIAGVLTLTATGAAAATGSLPGPAQDQLSSTASHFGIDLPSSDDEGTDGDDVTVPATVEDDTESDDAPDSSESESDDTQSSDDTESDSGDDPSSDAPAGNPNDNHGADVSSTAHDTEATGRDHGAAVSDVANQGHPDSDHPTPDDHPGNTDHPTPEEHPGTGSQGQGNQGHGNGDGEGDGS
jgi:Mg-chelatase subunit ChlI